jgi:hypothetical protein
LIKHNNHQLPRWRADYLGKKPQHLGTVESATDREAIDAAARLFNITSARRFKIVVTKVEEKPASRK